MDIKLTDMERAVKSLESATSGTVIYWIEDTASHKVYVATNSANGCKVEVSAADGDGNTDTKRFYVNGGSLSDWAALNTTQTIMTYGSNGVSHTSVKYRYGLTTGDSPTTSLQVNLTYTATTQ